MPVCTAGACEVLFKQGSCILMYALVIYNNSLGATKSRNKEMANGKWKIGNRKWERDSETVVD